MRDINCGKPVFARVCSVSFSEFILKEHALKYRYPWKPEEGSRCPGVGVADDCEHPTGHWEPHLGVLEEQQALLTAELFLQPLLLSCVCQE